ncbi:HNH endonuclease [Clostridium perfringens]
MRLAWDKRYDPDNCISLCSECHKKIDYEKR